jgi:macrodomain Ter protein organizer (MatP/YcbG family)
MSKKVSIKNPKAIPETADRWVDTRENKKRLTIDIPISLHTRLKIVAVKRGETMAEIICSILEEKLHELEQSTEGGSNQTKK